MAAFFSGSFSEAMAFIAAAMFGAVIAPLIGK